MSTKSLKQISFFKNADKNDKKFINEFSLENSNSNSNNINNQINNNNNNNNNIKLVSEDTQTQMPQINKNMNMSMSINISNDKHDNQSLQSPKLQNMTNNNKNNKFQYKFHKSNSLYYPLDLDSKFTTKQYNNKEATHLYKDLYSTQSGDLIANLAKVSKHKFHLKKNKSQDFFNFRKKPNIEIETKHE